MNTKNLTAAVAVFVTAGTAFAGEITPWPELDNFKSTKTRAEVIAELQQAQASGTYVAGGTELPGAATAPANTARTGAGTPVSAASHGKTRAQVYQELLQAQAEGTYVVGGREFEEPSLQRPAATRHAGAQKNVNTQ
jgi:hypothetical protein